ncbi:MAG: GNAT family N-acetyltransferase [Muribaculaceae bacterium]|nr:GNAT family N-acetyltransferase [Muribaculaceae bacterium]
MPAIWHLAEKVNSFLGGVRYKQLKGKSAEVLQNKFLEGFSFSVVQPQDIPAIIEMYTGQNPEYIKNFNPHPFNSKTLKEMSGNNAYSLMKVTEEASGELAGYFFIRSFFVGKAFHGLITAEKFANRGIGSAMWKISMEICHSVGLRMFATMSRDNKASYKSARNGTDVNIVDHLENNFILIECQKLQN